MKTKIGTVHSYQSSHLQNSVVIKTGNLYSFDYSWNTLPSLGYHLYLGQLFPYCYVYHFKNWQTLSAQQHPICSDTYSSHQVLTSPWLHTCPFLGLDQWIFFLLIAMRKAVVKMIALDHIDPLGILISFVIFIFVHLFYLIRYKLDCPQRQSDLAQTIVSHVLLKYRFPVPTWPVHYTSFCQQQAKFWSRCFSLLFLCCPSGFLNIHRLSSLKFPSTAMPKLTIFRLPALCLLSWSGPLLFFGA